MTQISAPRGSDLTEAEAIALFDSKFWKPLTHQERAVFQMFTERLCMPFDVFHEAMEKTLRRPVFTHEFGLNYEGLKRELLKIEQAPTFQEVLDLIPPEKHLVVVVPEGDRQ